jgi:hydroxymethylglutaryl-CoA reductase
MAIMEDQKTFQVHSGNKKQIQGFSKLSKQGKLEWMAHNYFNDPEEVIKELSDYWHPNEKIQKLFDEFSENTITNYYMPYGIVPNVLLNGKWYCVPMVIEESSVVAAAAKSAKFWSTRGGFHAEVIDTKKIGQVHFLWKGDKKTLQQFFKHLKPELRKQTASITKNMEARGGGILDVELVDMTQHEPGYYQLKGIFETCDSMGANFINSVLEKFAETLKAEALTYEGLTDEERDVHVIMSILSNYTPECLVKVWVECPVKDLGTIEGFTPEEFAWRFEKGIMIAHVDVHRATTHNKGIFNGIDAVILATGNDFRAVEAAGHTHAARSGKYSSLSYFTRENDIFKYTLEVPLALGTVGGLTSLHPIVKRSLQLLGNPSARELMMITAAIGLANNFAAIKSMVTVGIQKGHMKMHLLNILKSLSATDHEIEQAKAYFATRVVSYTAVRQFLNHLREERKS